jgi:hypothetical protein
MSFKTNPKYNQKTKPHPTPKKPKATQQGEKKHHCLSIQKNKHKLDKQLASC